MLNRLSVGRSTWPLRWGPLSPDPRSAFSSELRTIILERSGVSVIRIHRESSLSGGGIFGLPGVSVAGEGRVNLVL